MKKLSLEPEQLFVGDVHCDTIASDMSMGIHKTRGYPYHCDTVLQSQYEHATIIYEEITNLYEQPHAKNIDVTHKERP